MIDHQLPPQGSEIREMFTIEQLVAVNTGKEPTMPTLESVLLHAQVFFDKLDIAKETAVTAIGYIHRTDSNNLVLTRVNRDMSSELLWVFGQASEKVRFA